MTTKINSKVNDAAAVKASRAASCRKRQLKDFLRHCDRKGYTAGERALLIALWIHTPNDVNGASCYPKIGSLAALAGLSERQVTRALSSLADAGELWIARPGRDRGGIMGAFTFAGKKLDRGVNVYLMTYFASDTDKRQWAAIEGTTIEGTGREKYNAAPAGQTSAKTGAAAGA
jgi:hypothetical protein